MKRFTAWVMALSLCVIFAQAAIAQGGGGGRQGGGFGRQGGFGFGGGMMLLSMPEVQKELKMTPEQNDKVKTKQADVRTATQAIMEKAGGFQALRDMSPEDRTKLQADMQEVQTKAVKEVLDETQMKRFHQLELQRQGPNAFTMPEVKKALDITDEQSTKIAAIQMEQQQAMRDARQGFDPQNATADDRAAMQKKMADAQKVTLDKTLAVLTPDQAKKWKEMTGEPFKFPAMGPGGPGGRRPGAPGA